METQVTQITIKPSEIFWRFLLLGCMSFGGPAAHIGYFQRSFVEKLNWVSQNRFSQLVALSHFLPGPGSSQVGFAIGLQRAGLAGGIAAFTGFTLPSFLLMVLIASGLGLEGFEDKLSGAITGLKLFAVIIVADAIITMYNAFCRLWFTRTICFSCAMILTVQSSISAQMALLTASALIGFAFSKKSNQANQRVLTPLSTRINWPAFILFCVLFVGLPILANLSATLNLVADFYHAGSLVFGGGHVVLPLLQHTVGGELSADEFLTGYASAQAVPGPMFTLATYLGAMLFTPVWLGALIATLAIFVPGFILIIAFQDGWEALMKKPHFIGATLGINAAVVGLLLAAFYQPVITNAIKDWTSVAYCIAGLIALRLGKVPIVILIIAFTGLGTLI